MTSRSRRIFIGMIACAIPLRAQAQVPQSDRPLRRVEAAAGAGLLSGSALGSADANLRANETTLSAFRLFGTDSRFAGGPLFEVRGGYALNRRFAAEGVFVDSQPELRTSLSRDIEGAPSQTVVEGIDQYFFEGSFVVMLDELRLGRRTVPFAAGGIGYLRQLHEGLTVIEEGHLYHLGGGLKHWLAVRNRGRIRAAGVRADARLYLLSHGIAFKDRPRPLGAISGSFFIGF
jgi:hypothetical protein